MVLKMKPKILNMLGKHSPTELHPQTLSDHFHQIICLFLLIQLFKDTPQSTSFFLPYLLFYCCKDNSLGKKALIEGLLTLSEIQFLIITTGSMVAFRQALEQ